MTTSRREVRVVRAYDPPRAENESRILVDRIWPRGLSKERAHIDEWCKAVAPSTELRKWYGHDPDRYAEFIRRYRDELCDAERAEALAHLRELAERTDVALLTATKKIEISQAAVLGDLLREPKTSP